MISRRTLLAFNIGSIMLGIIKPGESAFAENVKKVPSTLFTQESQCKAKIQSLCPLNISDPARLIACIKKEKDNLLPECKKEFERYPQGDGSKKVNPSLTPQQNTPCTKKIKTICGGDINNPANLVTCIKKEKDKLLPECKKEFEKYPQGDGSKKVNPSLTPQQTTACNKKIKTACGGNMNNPANFMACIKKERNKLLPECKKEFENDVFGFNSKKRNTGR